MNNKSAFLLMATAMTILAVILIAANHLQDLNSEVITLENERAEETELRGEVAALESRLNHLEHRMPKRDLEQSAQQATMELSYVEDLLGKVSEIETVFGRIIGYEASEGILLQVDIMDSNETVEIPVADNCTLYMVTEIIWAPIASKDFMEFLEEAAVDSSEVFTFKMVEGKAVQIFQGEKRE
jgi:hypothetical protein